MTSTVSIFRSFIMPSMVLMIPGSDSSDIVLQRMIWVTCFGTSFISASLSILPLR